MSIFKQQVKKSEGGDFEVAPTGSHAAVCVALIDLGTHNEQFPGQAAKDVRKLLIAWELTDEKKADGSNHIVGRDYTVSLHEKAALNILIKGWRGKPLVEGEDFDILKLLKQKCQVNISHKPNGDGTRNYARVESVSQTVKGLTVPPHTVEPISWEIESGAEFPDAEWLPRVFGMLASDKVKECLEYKKRGGAGQQDGEPEAVAVGAAMGDDAIPF